MKQNIIWCFISFLVLVIATLYLKFIMPKITKNEMPGGPKTDISLTGSALFIVIFGIIFGYNFFGILFCFK